MKKMCTAAILFLAFVFLFYFSTDVEAKNGVVSDLDGLKTALEAEGKGQTIYVSNTIYITDSQFLYGEQVTLCRIGNFKGPLLAVTPTGSLTIEGLTLNGQKADDCDSLIFNEGECIINPGTVLKDNQAENGGGVYSTGRLILNGGVITGNSAAFHGGGIWSEGYLLMRDGSIQGNRAAGNGGGLYCDIGNFMIQGGNLRRNEADCGGYDIYSQYKVYYSKGSIQTGRCYGTFLSYEDGTSLAGNVGEGTRLWYDSYPSNSSFIIGGLTYKEYGFESSLKVDREDIRLIQTQNGLDREIFPDLWVCQTLSFVEKEQFVEVTYQVRNTGLFSREVALGVGADIQFGDYAAGPVWLTANGYRLEDDRGQAVGYQAVFQCEADRLWLGSAEDGSYYHNLFSESNPGKSKPNSDSVIAFSWNNRILDPGQTQTFRFRVGLQTVLEQLTDSFIRSFYTNRIH